LSRFYTDTERRLGCSVTVELFGLPADSVRGQKAHRVKASAMNMFNVIYSDPGFTFKKVLLIDFRLNLDIINIMIIKIIMPHLALLNITVYDEQNKIIGQRVLPVIGLRPGYKYITLKNECNQQINMYTLFVHIELHDYVPEEFEGYLLESNFLTFFLI
jgi:phosphatidylinositol phospholipase C beta